MRRPTVPHLIARGAVAILIAAAVVVCGTAAFAQHQWTTETECGVILHPSGTDLEYLADDGRWLTVARPSQEFTFAGPWSLTFRRADRVPERHQDPYWGAHRLSGDGCVPPTTTEPPTTTTTEGTTTTWPTTTSQPPTTTGPDATTTSTSTVANSTTTTPTLPPTATTTPLAPPSSVVPTTTTPGSAATASTHPPSPPPTDPTVSTPGSSTAPAAELPHTGLSDVALIAGLVLVSVGGGMVGVSRWRGRRT